MPIKVNCDQCGKEKEIYPYQYKKDKKYFCNYKCYGMWRSENTTGKNNLMFKGKIKVNCVYCGKEKEIYPYQYKEGNFFCDKKCYDKWQCKDKIKVNCAYCGKEKEIYPSLYKNGNFFCSHKCQGKFDLKNKVKVSCAYCGKEKEVKLKIYKRNKKFFCSHTCHGLFNREDIDHKQKVSGSNHYNWNNGSKALPYSPEFYYTGIREATDKLFDYTCFECESEITKPIDAHDHHVDYNKFATGHIDNPFLMVLLCGSCHPKTNGIKKRKEWQQHFMDKLEEKFKLDPLFEELYKKEIMYRNENKPKMILSGERYGSYLIKMMIAHHQLHNEFIPPYYSISTSSGNEV